MNIYWSKAPEGATHFDLQDGNWLQQFSCVSLVWDNSRGWADHHGQYPKTLSGNPYIIERSNQPQKPVDHREQTRQAIIDLAAKQCGISDDSIRQLATVLAAEGYRKFEIVEDDV